MDSDAVQMQRSLRTVRIRLLGLGVLYGAVLSLYPIWHHKPFPLPLALCIFAGSFGFFSFCLLRGQKAPKDYGRAYDAILWASLMYFFTLTDSYWIQGKAGPGTAIWSALFWCFFGVLYWMGQDFSEHFWPSRRNAEA